MPTYPDCNWKYFRLDGVPPGIFGETYAIVIAIHTVATYFKGEWYVLTRRPEPSVKYAAWRFDATDVPSDFLTVDLDFMIDEGRRYAEACLLDALYQRAEETRNPALLGVMINLVACEASPLVGSWLRNVFHEEIEAIRQATECESFSRYLTILSSLRPFSPK